MNHVFRVVFNKHLGMSQVVSEYSASHTKSSASKSLTRVVQTGMAGAILGMGLPAFAAGLVIGAGETHTGTDQLDNDTLTLDGGTWRMSGNTNFFQGFALGTAGGTVDTQDYYLSVGGPVTGSGGLVKEGSGTLTLIGTSSYSGPTVVNAGMLSVNGKLPENSTITVKSGAELSGIGQIGHADIQSGGVLSSVGPTTSGAIGLRMAGELNFRAGSAYHVPFSVHDVGQVTADAGIHIENGVTVRVTAADVNYSESGAFEILKTANGTINGTFDPAVAHNFAFLTPSLSYSDKAVTLDLKRNATQFAEVASGGNQQAVAALLDRMVSTASGDLSAVITELTGLSAEEARTALATISGATLTNLGLATSGFAGIFGNQMQNRLQGLGAYAPDFMFATNNAGPEQFRLAGGFPVGSASQPGFWLRGHGNYQRAEDKDSPRDARLRTGGMSTGLDARISRNLLVGGAFSYSETTVNSGINDNGKTKSTAIGAYASYETGPWGVNGNLMLGHNANNMQREVRVGGISRQAASDFSGYSLAGYAEVTYDMYFAGVTLQPLAGFSVLYSRTNGFTEKGADALNLTVSGQTSTTGRGMLGARAFIDIGKVRLQPRAIWAHDLGRQAQSLEMRLAGAPSSAFLITGTQQRRSSVITGLTLSGAPSENTTVFADVQGEFRSGVQSYGATVGMRLSW